MASVVPWTAPPSGIHPRIWVNPNSGLPNYGITIAQVQARVTTTHATYWNTLKSYCSTRLNTIAYPNSYYDGRPWEQLAAFAFVSLIGLGIPADASFAASCASRAIALGLYFAAKSVGDTSQSTNQKRQWMMGMAAVYDWMYNYSGFSDANKVTIRNALGNTSKWIDSYQGVLPGEYLWGTSDDNLNASHFSILAILNDSNLNGGSGNPTNATWNSWHDAMMDEHDNGTNTHSYWAVFRHLSKSSAGVFDGGFYKGIGQFSYWTRLQEFLICLLPALRSAVAVTWDKTEDWWANQLWDLWHWRGDRTLHRMNDHQGQAKYSPFMHAHCYQTQATKWNAGDQTMAKNIGWLTKEMDSVSNIAFWAPYEPFRICFMDAAANAASGARPTIATMGGGQMRVFQRSGKVVFREGWEAAETSVTICIPPFFTGGHQRREVGHWDLCTQGVPLIIENGHYDPNDNTTYKTLPPGATPTGHRWTYHKRELSLNVLRIHHSDEPASNPVQSFQGPAVTDSTRRFGTRTGTSPVVISNSGGPLWPKDLINTKFQPDDLTHLLSRPEWNMDVWPIVPVEDSKYCYAVANLQPWYWATKCTRYKRHYMWIKKGEIPGWNFPVLLMFVDVIAVADATFGKKTVLEQFQTNIQPVFANPAGDGLHVDIERGPGRVFVRFKKPASLEAVAVDGYKDGNGEIYTPTRTHNYDDSIASDYPTPTPAPWRAEVNPVTFDGTIQMLYAVFPCDTGQVAPPAMTLIDDATWIGVTFTAAQIEAKMKKGDTHEATVRAVTATPPPPPPPDPPPASPSTNTCRRSMAMTRAGFVLPVADGTTDEGDRAHMSGLYACLNYADPPIDLTLGVPISCNTPIAGGSIGGDVPASSGGTTITTDVPAAVAGEEIGCS